MRKPVWNWRAVMMLALSASSEAATRPRLKDFRAMLPLSFEPNQGQADPQVKYLSRGAGYTLFLTSTEAVLCAGKSTPVRMKWTNANQHASILPHDPQSGITNYFIGNDPAKWQTRVSTYRRIEYTEVYPGINLIFYGNGRQLEYDVVAKPGADLSRVRMRFDGVDRMRLDSSGDLVLNAAGVEMRQRKPVVIQEERQVNATYAIHGNEIGFKVAGYDPRRQLVIDPVLSFSTYLGGSAFDQATGIALDAGGNIYVTGTGSPGFPTAHALQP